jgi:glycerophosphoryl diester phosphodiesterase
MNYTIIAHRGWSGQYPENTLISIKQGLSHPLVKMIEIDVQLSSDGVPIIIHDYTLERTTNGTGFVGNYTLKELKQLDAGSWYSQKYRNERIPTLEEVFQLFKPFSNQGKKLNLEIKKGGNFYPGIEKKVASLIKQYGLEKSIVITSFNHESIRLFSRIAPDIQRGLLIYGVPVLTHKLLRYTRSTLLSMCYPYLTPEFIKPWLNKGVQCMAWTIDDPRHMQQILSIDARIMICTNHPERFNVLFSPK